MFVGRIERDHGVERGVGEPVADRDQRAAEERQRRGIDEEYVGKADRHQQRAGDDHRPLARPADQRTDHAALHQHHDDADEEEEHCVLAHAPVQLALGPEREGAFKTAHAEGDQREHDQRHDQQR